MAGILKDEGACHCYVVNAPTTFLWDEGGKCPDVEQNGLKIEKSGKTLDVNENNSVILCALYMVPSIPGGGVWACGHDANN